MPPFKWYKKYSVNNVELDRHHKKLIRIFNNLYDNCLLGKKDNCIGPIIDELVSYADYHFKAEEKYMADIGYKDIDNHILMHRYFTKKALQMKQVENKDDYKLKKELVVFLGNWLLDHVFKEDKKISF